MFIVSKFMEYLIYGVMLFFWTHVMLWFYREFMDRCAGVRPQGRRGASGYRVLPPLQPGLALDPRAVRDEHDDAGGHRHHAAVLPYRLGARR